MHKSQILFFVLCSFLVGVFIASIQELSRSIVLIGVILSIGTIFIFGYHKTYSRRGLFFGFLLLFFIFGAIRFNSFNTSNSILKPFVDLEARGKRVTVKVLGYVDGEPDISANRIQFIFRAKSLIAGDENLRLDEKIIITSTFSDFEFGERLLLEGTLRLPENFSEDFDYITYLKKQDVRITMAFPEIEKDNNLKLSRIEASRVALYKNIFIWKNRFQESINVSLPEPSASFVSGILLGSRQDISDSLKEAFNRTGTTHILAISGYNIMIISWAVLEFLVFFFKRRTAFWISVVIITLFTILTGASASVVRASIMGLILLFAHGYGRLYDSKNSIILAGALMVFLNPFSLVFDIGFQLSFAAVLGLLYIYPYLESRSEKIPKLGSLKEITLMTISAQIAVAPLLIYYFKQFSFLSLPANILILPLVPYAMLFGFVSGLMGMIYPVAGILFGYPTWAVTTYQIKIVQFIAGL